MLVLFTALLVKHAIAKLVLTYVQLLLLVLSEKMKKTTLITLLLILITTVVLLASQVKKRFLPPDQQRQNLSQTLGNNSEKGKEVILYYGITCPHCEVVEEWLEENTGVKQKSDLIAKEVYQNRENSRELGQKAAECSIDESQGISVPFLYDNGRCIIGDQPIIDYLKEKYQ